MRAMIRLFDVQRQNTRLRRTIDERMAAVMDHGQFILGPEVAELENRLAEYASSDEVVTVSSGRDALLIALMAEGIGAGDAVFVPAFTFSATAEVVVACGATPVFVDVDPRTFNINVDSLEEVIKSVHRQGDLRGRAIIAVDLYGLPADYRRLNAIADAYGLFLLADAAQSFGGAMDGRKAGSLAPVTAVSFYPTKPLGAFGDGGALFTRDAERAERYRGIRINGRGPSGLQETKAAMSARLDTLQAAVLLSKLDVFEAELERRRAIAGSYQNALGNVVQAPFIPDGFESAYALYTIQCDARDALRNQLTNAGIDCGLYYPKPLHLHPAFMRFGCGEGYMPVAEDLCSRVLNLPMHPYLREEEVDEVCRTILSFAG